MIEIPELFDKSTLKSIDNTIKYLLKGFEATGLDVPFEMINLATEYFGGFAGWLAEFGRTLIQEYNTSGKLPPTRGAIRENLPKCQKTNISGNIKTD